MPAHARLSGASAPAAPWYRDAVRVSLLRRLVYSSLVALAGLLALELGARLLLGRLVAAAMPSPELRAFAAQPRLVFDPELGWVPAPPPGTPLAEDLPWFARDLSPSRRPGVARGFALGDSQTLGAGMRQEQAWPAVAEAHLRALGHPVEIINAASPGFRSAQVLRLVESKLLAWDFDFLLVDCQADDSPPLPRRDYAGLRPLRGALFGSRLYRLLWLGVASARGQATGPGEVIRQPKGHSQEGPGNHAALIALAEAHGVAIWFLDYPFLAQPVRALAPPARLPPGATVIETTPVLLGSGRSGEELFFDNNHLTVLGSALVGRTVAEALAREPARLRLD